MTATRTRAFTFLVVSAAAVVASLSGCAPSHAATAELDTSVKKEIAMEIVSSAENSSLNWKEQYSYIEDIGDGRGYTGGIIGFTSGTGDMLAVVQDFARSEPRNALSAYIPALKKVNGTASHAGLGNGFEAAWRSAGSDSKFRDAQNAERDGTYFNPAVSQGKSDGLSTLGQFIYYDAIVVHGPGSQSDSFGGIRSAALKKAKSPKQGGSEKDYLTAFMNARNIVMKQEEAHSDTSRIDTAQRVFLAEGNYELSTPLKWKVYGESYQILKDPKS